MKFKKYWQSLVSICLLLFCGFFTYSCATKSSLKRSIAAPERDPITGIILGAEARTLLPESEDSALSNTACLLIHGFGGTREDLGELGERLAQGGITVREMRLPGHGTSPVDFAYQPPGAHLAAVREEFNRLKRDFDQVHIVGFSMGGALGTILAAEEQVDGLVLISPYYKINYRWYYILPAEAWNSLMGWAVPYAMKTGGFIRINDRTSVGKFYCYSITCSSGTTQAVKLARRARSKEVLDQVECPVLMMHAQGDLAASYKKSRLVYQELGAPKEFFSPPRSNHVLLWDYDKEEVIARVETFLGIESDGKGK